LVQVRPTSDHPLFQSISTDDGIVDEPGLIGNDSEHRPLCQDNRLTIQPLSESILQNRNDQSLSVQKDSKAARFSKLNEASRMIYEVGKHFIETESDMKVYMGFYNHFMSNVHDYMHSQMPQTLSQITDAAFLPLPSSASRTNRRILGSHERIVSRKQITSKKRNPLNLIPSDQFNLSQVLEPKLKRPKGRPKKNSENNFSTEVETDPLLLKAAL